ncbi:MAG: hypothetical protein ACK4JY_00430 [Brevundimonas sp.]|uniref:hypothetical protein n=1 Tax=Brevundimonas sp. TaxID=1871086 RepID=UPI0039195BFF
MTEFRVFIYADGLVLPLVVPVSCGAENLTDRLQRIFAHDIVASRAEVWDGPSLVMRIDPAGIAGLVEQATATPEGPEQPDAEVPSVH